MSSQTPSISQPAAPKQPKRGRLLLTHGLVAVVALAVGAGVGRGKSDAATANASDHPMRTATATVAAKPTAPRSAPTQQGGSISTIAGDGEYQVGQDMRPGTYRTAGPADGSSGMCYWERDKDSSGSMDSIIANDNLAGSGLVTVAKGEIFKSVGCQNWVAVR